MSLTKDDKLALVLAIVLHVILAVGFIGGATFLNKKPAPSLTGNAIQAEAVSLDDLPFYQNEKKKLENQKKAEQARLEKIRQEKIEKEKLEAQKKLAEQKAKEAEIKKQKEQEAKKAEAKKQAELKAKKEAEAKKLAEEKAKALALKKQKALEAQKKAEAKKQAEAKKLAEKKAKEAKIKAQKAREARLKQEIAAETQRQMAAEQAEIAAAKAADKKAAERAAAQRRAQEAQNAKDLEQYISRIQAKIRSNWIRPVGSNDSDQCDVSIVQSTSGYVVKQLVSNCVGSAAFKASIEAAVKKAQPLPRPKNPDVFDRNINLKFRSEQ